MEIIKTWDFAMTDPLLTFFGIKSWATFVAAFFGSMASLILMPTLKPWQAALSVVCGVFIGVYISPVIIWYFDIPFVFPEEMELYNGIVCATASFGILIASIATQVLRKVAENPQEFIAIWRNRK